MFFLTTDVVHHYMEITFADSSLSLLNFLSLLKIKGASSHIMKSSSSAIHVFSRSITRPTSAALRAGEKKGGEIEGNRKLDGSRQNNHRDDIYTRRRYTRAVLTGGRERRGLPWRGTDSSSGNLRSKAKEKKKKKKRVIPPRKCCVILGHQMLQEEEEEDGRKYTRIKSVRLFFF